MKMKMLNNLQILFQMKRTIPSRLSQTKPRFSFTKRHRRRRNQTTEEQNYSEQRGNSKISQQSIKYKDHSHYHTNKPGTYVSAINGIEKETHKSKHIICILIIQIIVLKIQLQIITKKVSRLQRYHQLFWHNET